MGASQATGKTMATGRTSDGGASNSIGIINRNLPISGRASGSETSQKHDVGDGFFVHKRGGEALPILNPKKRNNSID